MIRKLTILQALLSTASFALAFRNDASFSLSNYQRARAKETFDALDSSRLHFRILFVDNNNFHGRIAEGIFARVLEYNDDLSSLFPASSTITMDQSQALSNAPLDAAAPDIAVFVSESLDLCTELSTAMGTSFNMDSLDEYDLIITMDDAVRSLILRSLPKTASNDEDLLYYGAKCRQFSDFWSLDFCNSIHNKNDEADKSDEDDANVLLDLLDYELRDRAAPFYDLVRDSSDSNDLLSKTISWDDVYQPRMVLSSSSANYDGAEAAAAAVPNTRGWPFVEASMLLASAGLTKFCQDTMDLQFEHAFLALLKQHFHLPEHLELSYKQADEQLQNGSQTTTGYFSPRQKQTFFEQHLENLRLELQKGDM